MVSLAFTPDNIVYCKARPLYIDCNGTHNEIVEEFILQLADYKSKYGYNPKIILIKNLGMIALGENAKMTDILIRFVMRE